jgi:hypothetical protein
MKFFSYLDDKYGFLNIDTDPSISGIDFLNYTISNFILMAKRSKEYNYKSFNEYAMNTLSDITRELIDFFNVHKIEEYPNDLIVKILDVKNE